MLRMSFLEHLEELRKRIILMLAGLGVAFVVSLWFTERLWLLVSAPAIDALRQLGSANPKLIYTSPTEGFTTIWVKLPMLTSLFLASPWVLYQVWAFVAPGLYHSEQRFVVPLLVSSTLLFYAGIAFAYFGVLPLVFKFLVGVAPAGVAVMTDINHYLSFVLGMFVVFGVAFETPVAIVLLVKAGFVTPARLASIREYVFLGAFIAGAILTPPDVLSQTLLALSIYALYEVGIVAARWLVPGSRQVEEQQKLESVNRE
jgi:sec-independent protein translocase protein TatC